MLVDQLRDRFGVEPVCRVLNLCPGTYCGRKRRRPSARGQRNAVLSEQIEAVHQASYGTYVRLPRAQATAPTRRAGGALHGRTTDARPWLARRAPPRPPAHHRPRRVGAAAAGPGQSAVLANRPDRLRLADITYVRT